MRRLACLGASFLLTSLVASAQAAKPSAVWMSRDFSWGVQCEGGAKAPEKVSPPSPPPRSDAGAPGLKEKIEACFRDGVEPAAAVECAAKAVSAAGISLREKRVESMSVCEACTCPAHALRLWLSVAPASSSALAEAGFKTSRRPPAQEP